MLRWSQDHLGRRVLTFLCVFSCLKAEKVATSAYACRWYSTDKRVTNLLAILLQKAQRPMVLTAGNFAAMSNRLFLSVSRL